MYLCKFHGEDLMANAKYPPERLDRYRPEKPHVLTEYQRGYNAGYQAGKHAS